VEGYPATFAEGPGPEPPGELRRPDGDVRRTRLGAVEKAAQELQELLAGESPNTDQIKAKLTAYRTVKEKAKKDLAKAQQDLKQIVTVKQEATLVLMGLLN
jgi:Spy/CpxP family protein refolding chaperone